jgi:uncharacterized protein (TIGR02246 family)
MKHLAITAILLIAAAPLAPGQVSNQRARNDGRSQDEAAIRRILANWDRGWDEFDARLAAMDYADDADWLNAFGRKKKGRAELQKFLTELFVRPDMKAARFTTTSITIRFIRPDVAVAYTDFVGVGQKTLSGKEMGKRVGHQIRVLSKEGGKWVIVSHQIMDERELAVTTTGAI